MIHASLLTHHSHSLENEQQNCSRSFFCVFKHIPLHREDKVSHVHTQCFHYSARDLIETILQQKSAGHTCPYCRCDIKGTETVLIEPYLPGGGQLDEVDPDDTEEDDHEDIELMLKEMAILKKVRDHACALFTSFKFNHVSWC